jgi:hypothetical protein
MAGARRNLIGEGYLPFPIYVFMKVFEAKERQGKAIRKMSLWLF